MGVIHNNQAANPDLAMADENRSWSLDGANNWQSVVAENMQSVSAQPNEMNEYDEVTLSGGESGDGTFDYVYDDNGNLVSVVPTSGDGPRRHYKYDAFDRLVRVTWSDEVDPGEEHDIARYAYDALGRRIERQTFGALTQTFSYYYLGANVIEEQHRNNLFPDLVQRFQFVWGRSAAAVPNAARDAVSTREWLWLDPSHDDGHRADARRL